MYFGGDGNLQVFTSCNTGEGAFVVNQQTLILSGVSYTEEVCNDQNAATADAHIQAVLTDGEVSFAIEADRMTLTRGELGLEADTE